MVKIIMELKEEENDMISATMDVKGDVDNLSLVLAILKLEDVLIRNNISLRKIEKLKKKVRKGSK